MTKKTILFIGPTIDETAKALVLVTSRQEWDRNYSNSWLEGAEKIRDHLKAHPVQYGEMLETTTVLELKDEMVYADVIWIVDPAGSLRLTATKIQQVGSSTEGDEDQMPGHDEPCQSCGEKGRVRCPVRHGIFDG